MKSKKKKNLQFTTIINVIVVIIIIIINFINPTCGKIKPHVPSANSLLRLWHRARIVDVVCDKPTGKSCHDPACAIKLLSSSGSTQLRRLIKKVIPGGFRVSTIITKRKAVVLIDIHSWESWCGTGSGSIPLVSQFAIGSIPSVSESRAEPSELG